MQGSRFSSKESILIDYETGDEFEIETIAKVISDNRYRFLIDRSMMNDFLSYRFSQKDRLQLKLCSSAPTNDRFDKN